MQEFKPIIETIETEHNSVKRNIITEWLTAKIRVKQTTYINGLLSVVKYYRLVEKMNVPISIAYYYKNGQIEYISYYLDSNLHNENGPAAIAYHENGSVHYTEYRIKGTLHNKGRDVITIWDKKGNRMTNVNPIHYIYVA